MHEHEQTILAHWVYTKDEWHAFLRWTKKRKGFFHYLLHRVLPKTTTIPEVRITPERIWIGDRHQHFSSEDHFLNQVDIRDAGDMNIIAIRYYWTKSKEPVFDEINVPVPRGKLKEAIQVEGKLNALRNISRPG